MVPIVNTKMYESGLLHFLNQDLVNIFQPFQFLLAFLAKLRFQFYGNQLKIPNFKFNVYILLFPILVISFYIVSIMMVLKYNKGLLVNYLLLNTAYIIMVVFTTFQILITNKKGNIIKLMFIIQDIDHKLELNKIAKFYTKYRKRNLTWIASLIIFHLISFILEMIFLKNFYITIFLIINKLSIDVELVYFTGYVAVISSRLKRYNEILRMVKENSTEGKMEKAMDFISCYRKIIYANKLINKIWSFQVNDIIYLLYLNNLEPYLVITIRNVTVGNCNIIINMYI